MDRRNFLKKTLAGITLGGISLQARADQERPNIVWIIAEDMSCHFSYQGEKLVQTPHVDRLAAEGANFINGYITAPVCSAARSALITGMYQTSIGAHQHRSGRGKLKITLPEQIRLAPDLFHDAGYYVCNAGEHPWDRRGKTDYNFQYDNKELYDAPDWTHREKDQPFFAQIQLRGGKFRHGGAVRKSDVKNLVKAEEVTLPPYYPDHPVVRQDWADYLSCVMHVDNEVGKVMKRLKDEGIADNTIVMFITDHGISHARGKQFLYEEGIHIPFIIWAPERIKPMVREDFAVHIDMVATSLYFAGIPIPEYMQSRTLFGPQAEPRDYAVAARDRCDEAVDRIRCVRKGNYKYIRNFYPERPYLVPNTYKDRKEILIAICEWEKEGKLNEVQSLQLAQSRPAEELYYLPGDPWEVNNLAADPEAAEALKELREVLDNWLIETGDKGPESEAMYDSDMETYIKSKRNPQQREDLLINIKQMKQWAAEGK